MTLSFIQGFSSRKIEFHFYQFLSIFLKYSFSNFPSFHLYSIFSVNLPDSFFLLKSCSSATSNFFCLLTSVLILSLKSVTTSCAFPKPSFFSYMSYSAVNSFQHTKYFVTPLTFHLFNILFTFHSSSPSTSTSSGSSTLCFLTSFLYFTT